MASAVVKRRPFVPKIRLASSYKAVARSAISANVYPCGARSLLPAIHDLQYYQNILRDDTNFAENSSCDVFEISSGAGNWLPDLDEDGLDGYLKNTCACSEDTSLRVFYCKLERAQKTAFGHRLSLSQKLATKILESFHISPQFVPLLLGEPDYWSPGDFAAHGECASLHQLEFFAQQPRWNIHVRQTPCSIYMNYDTKLACTTYIIVSGNEHPPLEIIKTRLVESFDGESEDVLEKSHAMNPFLLHCMISHESLVEAKSIISALRYRLYDQLDMIDLYAKEPSKRKNLEKITVDLHSISQDTDSLLASADMAHMIAERMISAHERFELVLTEAKLVDKTVKLRDSLRYLQTSIQSQKRWLLSYKSRKDIAMNLVFNLVTQQDSLTSTTIARDTKADSSAMKTIAAITMVFLPGTFVSSIFGLPFIRDSGWQLYTVITLPLTLLVILIWWVWISRQNLGKMRTRMFHRTKEKLDADKTVEIV